MNSVLLSIQPQWCELIASGKKTIEVRKTKPKLDTPFKCYMYCTNKKPYLVWGDVFRGNWETEFTHLSGYNRKDAERIWGVFNGKIIGEFVCDYIISYIADDFVGAENLDGTIREKPIDGEFAYWIPNQEELGLTYDELHSYGNGKTLYGWHISDLIIYDEPRELREFYVEDTVSIKQCKYRFRTGQPEDVAKHGGWIKGSYACMKSGEPEWCENCITKPLTRPPQSWCYIAPPGGESL